jgi:hypothetical protein
MEEVSEGIPLGEKLPVRMRRTGKQSGRRKNCGKGSDDSCRVEGTCKAGVRDRLRRGQCSTLRLTARGVREQLGDRNARGVRSSLIQRGFELRSPTQDKQGQKQIIQPGKLPSGWELKCIHSTLPAEIAA